MELRDDPELREVLREWKAPEVPAGLESRVLRDHRPWWAVLVHGYIRVPVPVACCLLIVMVVGAWRIATQSANGCATASVAGPRVERGHAVKDSAATCSAGSNC